MDEREKAIRLFMAENPTADPDFASDVISFNWGREVRRLEDLVCIEQYANTYSDSDAELTSATAWMSENYLKRDRAV